MLSPKRSAPVSAAVLSPPRRPDRPVSLIPLASGAEGPQGFAPGTEVETARGAVAVEALKPADRIVTRDHGLQPIRWVRRVRQASPAITLGALSLRAGHRILITGAMAELWFAAPEVLVPAEALSDAKSIASPAYYTQILCHRHEIIRAGGHWTETLLLPGPDGAGHTAARPCLTGEEARVLRAAEAC